MDEVSRLLATGETEDGRAYFVTEWIAGKPCGEVAATMRAVRMSSFPCHWYRCARISSMLTLIYTAWRDPLGCACQQLAGIGKR